MGQTPGHTAHAGPALAGQDEVVRAVVEATNDRGARLAGIGWANYSRFAAITPPEVGQEVEVALRDGKPGGRWIQSLRVVDAGARSDPADGPFPEFEGPPADAAGGLGASSASTPGTGGGAPPRRVTTADRAGGAPATPSRTAIRLACLGAAARFLAGRTDCGDGDVLGAAIRFEAWIDEPA